MFSMLHSSPSCGSKSPYTPPFMAFTHLHPFWLSQFMENISMWFYSGKHVLNVRLCAIAVFLHFRDSAQPMSCGEKKHHNLFECCICSLAWGRQPYLTMCDSVLSGNVVHLLWEHPYTLNWSLNCFGHIEPGSCRFQMLSHVAIMISVPITKWVCCWFLLKNNMPIDIGWCS